ncbi:MAG: hypothetical protein AAF587_42760 [Bacteroidota bacterium]
MKTELLLQSNLLAKPFCISSLVKKIVFLGSLILVAILFYPTSLQAGCYDINMPGLRIDNGCIEMSTAPTSFFGTGEYLWVENVNGYIFERIGNISADDNSNQFQSYSLINKQAIIQDIHRIHYRLKQVDLDGNYSITHRFN